MNQVKIENATSPRFKDFKEPKVLCLVLYNGGGTKLFQSYLDGHPSMYNIPAYPLLYFYPHWRTWEKQYAQNWRWATIIDIFCEKHASVIDSRRIGGFNGLDTLGENKNEHIAIDEDLFRHYLASMLKDEPVARRTFLLAVNYAFALCKNQDVTVKSVLLWHHHDYIHLDEFLQDFPEAVVIGTIRDTRPVVFRCYDALLNVDEAKLNESDCILYRSYVFYNATINSLERLYRFKVYLDPRRVHLIRHEDMKLKLETLMKDTCRLLDIQFQDSLLQTTYDGKLWWGHAIYNMPQVSGTYDRVISKEWQKTMPKIEIFTYEGIILDFYKKYGYELLYYKKDSAWNLVKLVLAILWPNTLEWQNTCFYFRFQTHQKFLSLTVKEALGEIPLKDYTWNATYLYKTTYTDHQLSRYRWYRKLLDKVNAKVKESPSLYWKCASAISRGIYVSMRYIYLLSMICWLPVLWCKRISIYWACLFGRLTGRIIWPDLLEFDQYNKGT